VITERSRTGEQAFDHHAAADQPAHQVADHAMSPERHQRTEIRVVPGPRRSLRRWAMSIRRRCAASWCATWAAAIILTS